MDGLKGLDETVIAILAGCMLVYVMLTAFHFVRAVGAADRGVELEDGSGESNADSQSSFECEGDEVGSHESPADHDSDGFTSEHPVLAEAVD